jgi:AAA+ ATPase superfamily predicted ATPase
MDMDSPFTYNKFVTGSDFVGRQRELSLLVNLIRQGESVVIYEPPKSGKKSLVQQSLITLRKEAYNYTVCHINLFNVRTKRHLLQKFCNIVLDTFSNTPTDRDELLKDICPELIKMLLDTPENSSSPSSPEIDLAPVPEEIVEKIINIPEVLAQRFSTKTVIYIEEFQEILLIEDADDILKLLDRSLRSQKNTTHIITGSFVNSMKEIFEERRYFYNFTERVKIQPIDEKQLTDYIIRNFLKAGRVVSKELALEMYRLTDGHPWYAQQLGDISFALTRGYLTEQIMRQSFHSLVELHSYRFQLVTSRLSRFQINFLKAIMDDVTQLSALDTMTQYGFNSSANVKRLKDAVQKKEILTEESGKWEFLDPLFKTWLRKVYFEI